MGGYVVQKGRFRNDASQKFHDTRCRSRRILTESAASGEDVYHVAIFRFAKANIDDAMAAFRALGSAARQESGNVSYDIYRGIDDDLEFYIVEHWASPAALATHERTEAFIHFGQGVLASHATLHDAVTGRPFA